MSTATARAYQPYFAGRFAPFEMRKSPQNKAFYGHRDTYLGKAHCIKDRVLLDPACGSGNFLTQAYMCLRQLENEVLKERIAAEKGTVAGQIMLADLSVKSESPIKVSIQQFYGIEINDFACTVAKTALWIAESQMMKQTEDVLHTNMEFLPLKSYVNITEGNALHLNWNDVLPASECSFIMGNPPFIGARNKTKEQNEDMALVFNDKKLRALDYVACWYKKTDEYITGFNIRGAYVSTNSICQGEQVTLLWNRLSSIYLCFAYTTFVWNSEANDKAHVHCVIIGFSSTPYSGDKRLFDGDQCRSVSNINYYLMDADNIIISRRSKPICDVPEMTLGNVPKDDGNFILSEEEKEELIKNEPITAQWIRKYTGSREYINNDYRYVLWLKDANPAELRKSPSIQKRLENIRAFRENSDAAATRKMADYPNLFWYISQPSTKYLIIPRTSSQRRRYIPIGYLSPDVIASDGASVIPDANDYMFGILTSNVHNSFVRAFAGRLKSDYRYSGNIVYNTFPWPTPTDEQREKIEKTAQAILSAREMYPDCSLADLYDPLTMPPELQKAHTANNKAVMDAYGFKTSMSEAECVAELMKMYQQLTEEDK